MSEANATSKKTATLYEAVTMTDGRTVSFPGKTKIVKEAILTDAEGNAYALPGVRFDFRNGEVRYFQVNEAVAAKLMAHGALQKIGDAAAGAESLDDAILAIDTVIDALGRGEWGRERGKGDGVSGASILYKALLEVTGKAPAEVREFLDKMSQKEKIALRQAAKLRPVIERLEAEKAAKAKDAGIDSDALLGGLLD